MAEAIQTYSTALQLAPTYADAHYNLALAYEKIKEPRKALKHWRAYVKLDTVGPWAVTLATRSSAFCRRTGCIWCTAASRSNLHLTIPYACVPRLRSGQGSLLSGGCFACP